MKRASRWLGVGLIAAVSCGGSAPSTGSPPEPPAAEPAPAGVGVTARIHFNTQTADFVRAREFYRRLGFTAGVGGFPKTNTYAMARSLGMYDLCSYEIEEIEVISIPGAEGPTAIDLIQFRVPFNPEPPYAEPTHLGLASVALATPDFDAAVTWLRDNEVGLLSEPFGEAGERFVFFEDPDGVWLQLVETGMAPDEPTDGTRITAMPFITLNVSSFERSFAFYERLGYGVVGELSSSGGSAEAVAYGLDGPFERRGADIAIPGGDGNRLRLIEWISHRDDDPPYPPPINHIGIHRLALAVENLDRAMETLAEDGVEALSDIAPCCSGTGEDETGIINLIDPDGVFVELVGPIARKEPLARPSFCN